MKCIKTQRFFGKLGLQSESKGANVYIESLKSNGLGLVIMLKTVILKLGKNWPKTDVKKNNNTWLYN